MKTTIRCFSGQLHSVDFAMAFRHSVDISRPTGSRTYAGGALTTRDNWITVASALFFPRRGDTGTLEGPFDVAVSKGVRVYMARSQFWLKETRVRMHQSTNKLYVLINSIHSTTVP